ncbi:MAG TPA: hypothetical protein VJM31_06020 [Vicinamibacterales bacterium]|nr:hypothetical protein [Vicinamibacterales bacterium]
MERGLRGAHQRADLVGTLPFWVTIGVTLATVVPFVLFRAIRPWLACAVLLMWASFFTANAVRSRRTHSVISAPIYMAAATIMGGSAAGFLEVQVWMVWALGAGIIGANLSERFVGKYL